MRHFHLMTLIALGVGTDAGQGLPPPETCDMAALRAAEQEGVPPQLMLAITRVETGRQIGGVLTPWPWTINHAGDGHWFDTASDAATFVQQAIDVGQTNLDIGCFQLNLHWHAAGFDSLQTMLDPTENARYAALYLTRLHAEKGNWVDAAAAYHSATAEHATAYVTKLEAVLTSLSVQAPTAPSPDPNGFPLLQLGGPSGLASLVPQTMIADPLIMLSH